MAVQTSGSFSGSVNSGYQKLTVKWSSVQHEDTGSSTITAEMWFKSAGAISIGSRSNSATIDGTTKSWSSSSISKSSGFEIKLATVTQEVQHDQSTGKKTFSMSSVFNIQATLSGTYYSSITANSGNIELPTIARASTITVDPSNIGSATTIRITKANDNFSTSLYWRIKNGSDPSWISIGNTANDTYQWTPPASGDFNLYNSMTYTQKTITLEFLAITMNSSYIQVGDDKFAEQTFTAAGNPTVGTKTATDINSVTAQLSSGSNTSTTKMVNGASNIKVEVSATALNGAGIKSITVNGVILSLNGSASTVTRSGNYTFNKATTNVFAITVLDSRDHTTMTTTNTLTAINYVPLTLNITNLKRHTPTDGLIDISVSGNYWNNSFRTNVPNTLTVQYQWQQSGGSWSGWNNITVTIPSGSNTFSGSTQLSGFDYTKVFNFNFKATDAVETVPVSNRTVPKGQPIYWWNENSFNVNGSLNVSNAINVANGVNFSSGHDKYIYWKENGYGDKFGISPDFNGADNSNHLRIRGAVGGAGTDPSMYDLAWISGKDGNAWLKGRLDIDGDLKTRRMFIFTLDAMGGASGRYYKLANIPATSDANSIQVNIKGDIGAWVRKKGTIDLQVCNREEFKVYGTLYGNPKCYESQTIVIYKESNNSHTIYLRCIESYIGPNTFEITWGGGAGLYPTIYTDYSYTTSPSGTLVWTSSHSTITPLCSMEGTNIVTRTGGATLTSSAWRRFGNVVQLTIVINTTSSTNTGSNAFTGTINNSALIPKIPINSSSYNGSTALNCYIDASGNITCRVLASNLSSGKEMTIGFTYVI